MNVLDDMVFYVASCVHYNHDYRKSPLPIHDPTAVWLILEAVDWSDESFYITFK